MKTKIFIFLICLISIFSFYMQKAEAQGCRTETSQVDFQAGAGTNIDLTSSPGDLTLNTVLLDQQNNTIGTSGVGITTTTWGGQTFTPAITGKLVKASIHLFCSGCTGTTPNLTVEIRNTSGGLPTGASLASGTITGFNSGADAVYTCTFATPATLTAGTQYGLLIRPSTNPSPGTYALSRSGTATAGANVYADGTRVAGATSGTVWSIPLTGGINTDAGFQTYITPSGSVSGDFTSQVLDAGSPVAWNTLSFIESLPLNTSINFQVATSNSSSGPFNFVGPDGTNASFYTTSGASLNPVSNAQYAKYKAYLSTTDVSSLPTLNEVVVCFGGPLAVHWLNISGNINRRQQPFINWQVEENNVASYLIERSANGSNYIAAGTVSGKGDGNHSYQFIDTLSLTGVRYYRIKQVDYDGKLTYSPVVKLSNTLQGKLSVYPNPATSSLITLTAGPDLLNTKTILSDIKGRILQEFIIASRTTTLDMSKYINGIYLLILADGSTQKIIKQ